MAIKFLEKRYLLFLLGFLLFFLLLFFVWQGFLTRRPSPEKTTLPQIKINFQIFEGPAFKALESFERIDSLKEGLGRENPFLPY